MSAASMRQSHLGLGAIDLNIDRGFVASSATEWTVMGSLAGARGDGLSQPERATLRVVVTAKE